MTSRASLAGSAARYAGRQASRHPVHHDGLRGLSAETFARSARPVGIGEVITLDTTGPADIAALADAVRARFR